MPSEGFSGAWLRGGQHYWRSAKRLRPGLLAAFRAFALAACGIATSAVGQGNTVGYILGEVASDSESLPGVSVTVRNVDTSVSRTTVTGSDGRYRFSALAVGRYEVTVVVDGSGSKPLLAEVNIGEGTVCDIRLDESRLHRGSRGHCPSPTAGGCPAV